MSETTLGTQVRTGVVLPNGWTVVDTYEDWSMVQFGDERERGIVLAMMPREYDKFATWSYVVNDRGIVTLSGHYFSHIFQAARDFGRRAGRPMPTDESE